MLRITCRASPANFDPDMPAVNVGGAVQVGEVADTIVLDVHQAIDLGVLDDGLVLGVDQNQGQFGAVKGHLGDGFDTDVKGPGRSSVAEYLDVNRFARGETIQEEEGIIACPAVVVAADTLQVAAGAAPPYADARVVDIAGQGLEAQAPGGGHLHRVPYVGPCEVGAIGIQAGARKADVGAGKALAGVDGHRCAGKSSRQRLGVAIPYRAEDVADRRGGAILKHDIPRVVLQDVGIFIFVLPRRIDQLQAVAVANGNGGRAPEVGGAVCALGDIVDQHLQRGAVPAVTVTVIHRQGVCAALRMRRDVPAKEQQQRKDGDEFSHGFKSALCTLFGGVNSIGRGSP